MEDSDVWSRDLNSATSPDMDSGYTGCAQTTMTTGRHPGHERTDRDLDIAPEGGCVYPQRQQAMIELDLSGRLRSVDASSYPAAAEETLGVARFHEVEGNCNVRSDDDLVYDEMLDFLPVAYNTFFTFDESCCFTSPPSRRPTAWASSSSSAAVGLDATPLVDSLPVVTARLKPDRRGREWGAATTSVKSGSCQVRSGARRTKAMSSVIKMIRSLDLLEEDDGQEEAEAVEEEGSGGVEGDETRRGSSVEGLDQVAAKVEAWTENHGQLIGAAYRRGVQSAEMRLKRLTHQLTSCKHRLFEVSRDRQVITTYVRRHEQSWSCRHDRLRMEVLRLQKLIHDLQKSPDQLDENRQMYEGERGEDGGGSGGTGSGVGMGTGGGVGGGGGGAAQRGKTDETMDKLLSVIVEHQSRINELKLTVFAQQQHILSLEEVLREHPSGALLVEDEAETLPQQQQPWDVIAPDPKSRCSKSNPITKESNKHDSLETADGIAATCSKPTATLPSPSSPAAATTFCNFISSSSKMSDVLLCDEGDYRLCQTSQPEVATDSTLTNIRCLCHQNGLACSSSAQVQLVGQLPYLMDSPLDTEVAGVLARPKARPFSLADLPYVRHSIAQRLTPEQTPADIDFLF